MPGKYQENFHPAFKIFDADFKALQPNTLGNVATQPRKRFRPNSKTFRSSFPVAGVGHFTNSTTLLANYGTFRPNFRELNIARPLKRWETLRPNFFVAGVGHVSAS
jgi:hypothetical protein